jgi:hypothetical protein
MTHPSTFDHGALARCCTHQPRGGDLGDVWDTAPEAVTHILDGPRKIEVVRGEEMYSSARGRRAPEH